MLTWGYLRQWKPQPLQDAIGALNAQYNKLVASSDDVRDLNTPYGWVGNAATAAADEGNAIIDSLEEWAAEIAAGRRALAEAGDALTGVAHAVHEADNLAAANNFTIADTGDIQDHGVSPDIPEAQREDVGRERERVAAELTDRVTQALRQAGDIDADVCAVLDRILSEHVIDAAANDNQTTNVAWAGSLGEAHAGLSIMDPPAGDGTPTQNAGWWSALSPAQQQRFVREHPELIGNRDGIAGWARNQANLAMLERERGRLQAEADELRRDPRALHNSINVPSTKYQQLQQVEAKLASLDTVSKLMHNPDGTLNPDRQLLLLDMSGDKAKAAVANGNIDTADHVAIFTPGMNSAVDHTFTGYVNDMAHVGTTAEALLTRSGNPGATVATVAWLGYEPPATNVDPGNYGDLITGGSAEAGGAKLARFDQGINASRPVDPHMTALGHSWGSLTTGISLHNNTGVDDAVFFGSPGISDNPVGTTGGPAGELNQLQVPHGHAYALKADDDVVADVGTLSGGRYGSDPTDIPGMQRLSTHPAAPLGGPPTLGSTGHSEYLKFTGTADSTSVYNIAAIVSGQPQLAIAGN
ncbi:alpha/beta hydrolase [Amycolatopsis sp. NPDC004378]